MSQGITGLSEKSKKLVTFDFVSNSYDIFIVCIDLGAVFYFCFMFDPSNLILVRKFLRLFHHFLKSPE